MNKLITWNCDIFGRMLGTSLHDSIMTGLQFSEEYGFNLQVRTCSEKTMVIKLLGVSDINIVNICNGSIISDIYLWKVRESCQISNNAWNILFSERYGLNGTEVKARNITLENPESFLMLIDCSYGDSIAAICRTLEIFEISG